MTKFEEIGQKYQMQAYDINYAEWSFKNSCNICCYRGLHINCSNCAIAQSHSMIMAILEESKGEKKSE